MNASRNREGRQEHEHARDDERHEVAGRHEHERIAEHSRSRRHQHDPPTAPGVTPRRRRDDRDERDQKQKRREIDDETARRRQ